jgi:Lipid A 3-O-deacylase (PagL)
VKQPDEIMLRITPRLADDECVLLVRGLASSIEQVRSAADLPLCQPQDVAGIFAISRRAFHLILIAAVLLGCSAAIVTAQPSSGEAAPFHSEWLVLGGVGNDTRSMSDRQMAFQSVEWGHNLTGEHGPGVLKGSLEMVIEVTPVFVALQSRDSEGAGFAPVMFRWNFRQRGAIHPFLDAAAGMIATNRDVPENTTRLNFAEHVGGGARLRVADRWALVVGYRLHHLFNNGNALRNPGVTSHVGYVGVAWMSPQ